jgi:Ser-tRNA(Ala) deacylase AlaX
MADRSGPGGGLEMNEKQIKEEFKRLEELENKFRKAGNREAAYYYMRKKWEAHDQLLKLNQK